MSKKWNEAEYVSLITQIDRLHRRRLDFLKEDLIKRGILDINNIQALILFNIGDAEMTVGELTLRGCYLGSNVSYNLSKMIKNGYVEQAQSPHDRRSVHVRLTPKGRALRDLLTQMYRRLAEILLDMIPEPYLELAAMTLTALERGWDRVSDRAELMFEDADD